MQAMTWVTVVVLISLRSSISLFAVAIWSVSVPSSVRYVESSSLRTDLLKCKGGGTEQHCLGD